VVERNVGRLSALRQQPNEAKGSVYISSLVHRPGILRSKCLVPVNISINQGLGLAVVAPVVVYDSSLVDALKPFTQLILNFSFTEPDNDLGSELIDHSHHPNLRRPFIGIRLIDAK